MRHRVLFLSLFIALQQDAPVRFNTASEIGINFTHQNGATAEKYMPETMGGGGIFFDYDNDGWLDVFLVNGGSFANKQVAASARHRLYRNNGRGAFSETTAASGIQNSAFGMGACSADYDNDGWADLYITSVGANQLYRNTGRGAFVDVTVKAGAPAGYWSTSCAFADIDNDGDVDLYVANYVDFSVSNNKNCGLSGLSESIRAYCHPNVYKGEPDVLLRNNGDGTFTDVSRAAGIDKSNGNGLGVVFGDYDGDGWTDIFVANDSTPNLLLHNNGTGKFEDAGVLAGVAFGANGKALAGMGTDMGDIDGDGLLDIFVTNLDQQAHSLFRNLGKGLFQDVTFQSGVGKATLPFVGFGAAFVDFDNDMDLDLTVANGDVLDNIRLMRDTSSYEQVNLLLQNNGDGRFKDVAPTAGPGFSLRKPSRALAIGDVDNDGDMDILVVNVGQTADLLLNDGGNRGNALLVRTVGSRSNRDGIGARLKLTSASRVLSRYVKAGSSYLAQNDLRVHFGLGSARIAERLEILWPSGAVEVLDNIEANQIVTVSEGKGITDRKPLVKN